MPSDHTYCPHALITPTSHNFQPSIFLYFKILTLLCVAIGYSESICQKPLYIYSSKFFPLKACNACLRSTLYFINPRRACAARVTILGSCVCVCVCLSAPFQPLQVKVSPENDTNASPQQDKENKTGDFLKNAPIKSYGVICSLCRSSAVL